MPSEEETQESVSDESLTEELDGVPTFPPGTSRTHRRRLLKAMAGGGAVAIAGCLGLGDDDDEEPDEAQFELGNLSPSATEVLGGETVEISVEIENTGGREGTRLLEVRLDGERIATRDITLAAGQRDIASFELTAPDEVGDSEFGFYLNGTEAMGTLTVTETPDPAFFAVDLDVEERPTYRGEFDVGGMVENTGEMPGTKTVALQLDGEEIINEDVELEPGGTAEFSETVGQDPPGSTHTVSIESENDTDEATMRVGPPDYTAIDHMVPHWAPKDLVKALDTQVAYNGEEIYLRFQWDWDIPNGWFHDMFVYDDDEDEWSRYGEPNPGAAMEDYGVGDQFSGFTEDRLAFMIDDGSVEGFENFGGWLTIHEGTRTLPGAVAGEEVEEHPHHGGILENDDIRKYIPQSRNGEWWENDWDDVKDQDELDAMLENGEYLDMPMIRCHRGLPAGYATVHTILDHRHGAMDEPSTRVRSSVGLDEDGRPQYMFDPDLVENGALELEEIYDGNITPEDVHALIHRDPDRDDDAWPPDVEDTTAEFDPDIAEFDGAVIPRRNLYPDEVDGPGGLWKVQGTWQDGTWTIEAHREMQAGFLGEQDFEEGEVYDFSPAVHGGGAQRWHWVGYPYKLGIGVDPDWEQDEGPHAGTTSLVAEEFDGDEPDWDTVETYTIPLMYPGLTDWTWLTSGEHPRVDDIRNAEINIWEHHDESPEDFAQRMIELEQLMAPRK